MKRRMIRVLLSLCMVLSLLSSPVTAAVPDAVLSAPAISGTGKPAADPAALDLANLSTAADLPTVPTARDLILILDVSDSMEGTPIEDAIRAASLLCEAALSSLDDCRLALLTCDVTSVIRSGFEQDMLTVLNTVNTIRPGHGTDTAAAFREAKRLMDTEGRPAAMKSVVLLSDGIPQHGDRTVKGPYTPGDSSYYAYANTAFDAARELTEDCDLYTLGFFHSLRGDSRDFAARFLEEIQNGGFFPVTDPADLERQVEALSGLILPSEDEEWEEPFVLAEGVRQITFQYQNKKDYSAVCYYSDEYFNASAYEYNPSLATMSLCLAMSAAGSARGTYRDKSVNARNLLRSIGVWAKHIRSNEWFSLKPEVDSIGVIIGSKRLRTGAGDCTLIALALRGGGYEREWGSNFTLGTEGRHEGFDRAKENALAFLREYVKEQAITGPVKLWITGFSRAAAAANLLSGAIDDGASIGEGVTFDPEDVYAYCFETPAGAVASEVKGNSLYYNIFNIINQSDPVPFVAPAALNFGRYGMDRYLPSAQSSANYPAEKARMLAIYEALPSTEAYIVDDFRMKRLGGLDNWIPGGEGISLRVDDDVRNRYSQGVFLSDYVTIIARDFLRDRDHYVARYQDEIREVCKVVFGATQAQVDKMMESLLNQAGSGWGELVASYLWNTDFNPFGTKDDAFALVSKWLNSAIRAAGITDYSADTMDQAGRHLCDLLVSLIANHPNYFTTLWMNLAGIGAAHYPELCYAWLASMDPNYGGMGAAFNNGSYRVVRINCAVDVRVTDAEGNMVAEIIGDEPQEIAGSSIISAVDENGQKVVILPVDVSYQVSVTPRETVNPEAEGDSAAGMTESQGSGIGSRTGYAHGTGRTASTTADDVEPDGIPPESIPMPGGTQTGAAENRETGEITGAAENRETGEITGAAENRETGEMTGAAESRDTAELLDTGEPDGESAVILQASGVEVNYSVDEYSGLAGDYTRGVDFFRIALPEGERLTGEIPSYTDAEIEADTPEGSGAEYTLTVTQGEDVSMEISSNSDLSGPDAVEAWYQVTVASEDERRGVVLGGGVRRYGSFAQVEAAARDGFVLDGWYEDGILVSRDTSYRFSVTRDVELTARFREGEAPRYQVVVSRDIIGGRVTPMPKTARKGDPITLLARQDTTHQLEKLTVKDRTGATLYLRNGGLGRYTFTMPEGAVLVEAVFRDWRYPFTDVETGDYFFDAVYWAVENGVTVGTTPKTFAPSAACTRAQTVTFLWRAAGCPEATSDVNPFTDVNPYAYYYPAVLWAAEQGIIDGYSDGRFRPNGTVSRAQAVAFLYRSAGSLPWEGKSAFSDVKADRYFYAAVNWAEELGITSGVTDRTFAPDQPCTRSQIVAFLYRFYEG